MQAGHHELVKCLKSVVEEKQEVPEEKQEGTDVGWPLDCVAHRK